MTALDQAFIKAFTRQDTSPLAVLPRPAVPEGGEQRAEGGRRRAEDGEDELQSFDVSPNPFVPQDVWAALERTPKRAESLLKVAEGGGRKAEGGRRKAEGGTDELQPFDISSAVGVAVELPAGAAVQLPHQLVELPHQLGNHPFGNLTPAPCPPTPEVHPAPIDSLPVQQEFKPACQVDHFTWPRICRRLIARAAEELDRLAESLLAMNAKGQKVLAIGSCHRGEGATTLLLCAARRLAERGIKAVLVDADLGRPRLAKRLGVQPQFGWDETTDGVGRAIDQAIVEATANNLALLPAREPMAESGQPAGDPSRLPACLRILRQHYDLVLVDMGPLEDAGLADTAPIRTSAGLIDTVVLVHNHRITPEGQLTALAGQLAAAGIVVAGIVENFVIED